MIDKLDKRRAALITGVAIVVMTIVAGVIMSGVFIPLFEMNPSTFTETMIHQKTNYLFGVLGWIVIFIMDVLVSWGLYRYYLPTNKKRALKMGALRLIYSMILFIGIIQLTRSYIQLNKGLTNFEDSRELLFSFRSVWQFGLIIFGFHLLYLAPLVCGNGAVKKIIATLLFLAGIGYVVSNTADLFITDYEQIRSQVEVYFILPMIFGEVGLAVWLLIKGGQSQKNL